MTNRTALIWILGGLAAMLVIGRRKGNAPAIGGTPLRREPTADKLHRKIQEFIDEVRGQELTEEQRKIYSVFAGEQNVTEIKVQDILKIYDTFKVQKGNLYFGTRHILYKHYNARNSSVTANDILNMCEIIKDSMPMCDIKTRKHYYEVNQNGKQYKLVIDWKEKAGSANLITFYTK